MADGPSFLYKYKKVVLVVAHRHNEYYNFIVVFARCCTVHGWEVGTWEHLACWKLNGEVRE